MEKVLRGTGGFSDYVNSEQRLLMCFHCTHAYFEVTKGARFIDIVVSNEASDDAYEIVPVLDDDGDCCVDVRTGEGWDKEKLLYSDLMDAVLEVAKHGRVYISLYEVYPDV